jgi:NADH-quinone oxidoreductase subunit I
MKVGVKFNLADRLYLTALVKGMSLTFKHIFVKPTTVQYPEEKVQVYPRFRGSQRLEKREDGEPRCVACELCATVCPSNAIRIVADESDDPEVEKFPLEYEINLLRCVFCG